MLFFTIYGFDTSKVTNGLISLSQDIPEWFTTIDDLNPGFGGGGGKNLQRGYSNAGARGGNSRQSSDNAGYGGHYGQSSNAGGGYKQQQVQFTS